MKQKTVVIVLVTILIIMGLFSFFRNRNSNPESATLADSTIGDCVVSESNRGSKVYDDNDAVCYIFKGLKVRGEDATKEEIKHVLDTEVQYRETNPPVTEAAMKSGDPVPAYIFQHQTMGMSQAKIDSIYDAEYYYLQFIGVVN